MDIKKYLKEQKDKAEAYLKEYLDTRDDIPSELMEAMEYSLFAGGKRIRPILALAACGAVGGDEDIACAGGCAIEMIHTYSLIHDDLPCMDDDDLRRGKPTSHTVFGEAGAVLAGDGLLTMAFELISDSIAEPVKACTVIHETARAAGAGGMVGGQILDMKFESGTCSEKQLHDLHSRKTGALLRASVMIGVLSGQCSAEHRKVFSEFGTDLGLLFQVVDDILDIEGDTEKLGKTAGKDEASGKSTFVSILGLDRTKAYRDEICKKCRKALEILCCSDTILSELTTFIAYRDH